MNNKKMVLSILLAWLASSPVFAVLDPVPAATLLVPYFAVALADCNAPAQRNTLVTVTNAHSGTTLAHVTFWSDLSVPVLDFDIYLPSGVSETLDLRNVLCNGNLPQTGFQFSQHPVGDPGIQYANCNNTAIPGDPPAYLPDALSPNFRTHLRQWLTGMQSTVTGDCAGFPHGDTVARGYITIDTVTDCNLYFPSESAYYTNGLVALNNHLTGTVRHVDSGAGTNLTLPAVPIEADPTGSTIGVGDPSFYFRYLPAGFTDGREPLPENVTVTYDGANDAEYFVWRENTSHTGQSFTCGSVPAGYLLPDMDLVFSIPGGQTAPAQSAIALESNAVRLSDIGVPGAVAGIAGDLEFQGRTQTWVQRLPARAIATDIPTIGVSGHVVLSLIVLLFAALTIRGRLRSREKR